VSGVIHFIGRPQAEMLTPQDIRLRKSASTLYELTRPFTCICPIHGVIRVPEGFITDWASVPPAARWYVDDEDAVIAYPALIHDYLYSIGGRMSEARVMSREQVDDFFRRGMLACGARPAQAWIAHKAVRIAGGSHWGS
jgi:hypothetical protein